MSTPRVSYYVINGLTMYRLVSAPFLLLLATVGQLMLFKWLLAVSFLTDAIDGPLSRRFKVTSVFGARLDSVADDATVLAATVALWIVHPEFVTREWVWLVVLLALFGIQTVSALVAYKKVTSFHTYFAKAAAVVQALFFLMIFFQIGPVQLVFYIAVCVTGIQLLEEIGLVVVLPEWRTNVKGLYWVLRSKHPLAGSE